MPPVSFVDNQDLIDLIEKSNKKNPRLLVMLDEELNLIGAGSDKNFLKKATKVHAASTRLKVNLVGGSRKRKERARGIQLPYDRNEFLINHYAGSVKSMMFVDFWTKIRMNWLQIFKRLYKHLKILSLVMCFPSTNGSSGRRGRSKKESQGRQFRKQLKHLMSTLNSSQPHYIRCINQTRDIKKQICFGQQLHLSNFGIQRWACSRPSKFVNRGYPFRLKHTHFYQRYFKLISKTMRQYNSNDLAVKEKCKNFITNFRIRKRSN